MRLKVRDKLFDRQTTTDIIELMQQMVRRYYNLNVGCQSLRFYAPGHFIDEMISTHISDSLSGVDVHSGQLTVWGVEVHLGYENKIILFCPGMIPASQSPVMQIDRLGLTNMQIVSRH